MRTLKRWYTRVWLWYDEQRDQARQRGDSVLRSWH